MLEVVFPAAIFLVVLFAPAIPDLYRFFKSGKKDRKHLHDACAAMVFSVSFWSFGVAASYFMLYEGPFGYLVMGLAAASLAGSFLLSLKENGWRKLASFGAGFLFFVFTLFAVGMNGLSVDMMRKSQRAKFFRTAGWPERAYSEYGDGERENIRRKFRESLSGEDRTMTICAIRALDYLGKDGVLLLDELSALRNHGNREIRWLSAYESDAIKSRYGLK